MIDYTIPGTPLPEIPKNTPYRAVDWRNSEPNEICSGSYKEGSLISYGSKIYKSEVYVLADKSDYRGKNYLMFKLEDLNKLTKQENMGDEKLIGYKLIIPEYAEAALQIEGGRFIGIEVKNGQILYSKYTESVEKLKNAGVLNLWFKPVYEEEFKAGDWVVVTKEIDKNQAKVGVIGKIFRIDPKSQYKYCITNNEIIASWCEDVRKATQEEIIKAQEQKVDICGIELTIKDNKVFHDKDNTDITEYVKAIKLLWESTLNDGRLRLNNYDFIIDNISIKKTGCRTVNSDIKAWLNVAKMIK